MANQWTPEQEAAMSICGKTLLVSAAAGSGKTSVLTERIIRRLTDPINPAKLSEMLIVTFTRASAADLKAKIAKALSEALAADPGNRHLSEQLLSLGNAQISTIDSFFQKTVRANFDALDLPASFRTVDATEVMPLSLSLLQSLSEQYYSGMSQSKSSAPLDRIKNNPFAEAMDHLMSGRSDGKLDGRLYQFYAQFSSYPEGIGLLLECADRLSKEAEMPFFASVTGSHLKQVLREQFLSFRSFLLESTEKFKSDPDLEKKFFSILSFDTDYVQAVLAALETDSYDTVKKSLEGLFAFKSSFPVVRGAEKPDFVISYQTWRTKFKDKIKKLITWFVWNEAELAAQFRKTADLCQVLYRFFKDYKARLRDEKLSRGMMEYNDIRECLYELLTNPDGSPSPASIALSEQYKEVYIDEYQDVDSLQDFIFARVGGKNRFMVGDIKQSIYGFRGSDPSVFAGYRRAFPLYTESEAQSSSGVGVFMSNNFRCNQSVVDFANRICGFLFSACEESIGYRAEDDLVFSKKKSKDDPPDVLTHVAVFDPKPHKRKNDEEVEEEGSDEGIDAEAAWVANEIKRLLLHESLDNAQPIVPSDIAILVRAKNHSIKISRALQLMNIPVVAEAADNLMHESLMVDLLNLLRAIDNPYRDLPLSEFLLSELGGFTLEELTKIRGYTSDQKSIYDAMVAASEADDVELAQKVSTFIKWLEPLCQSASIMPADKFLRLLYLDERFLPYSGNPVLLYLYEQARIYQRSSFCGLYGLIDALNKQQENETAPPNGFKKSENAVSIMTVHHSKGLEFPVVFLCGCGKPFNKDDLNRNLLFNRHLGCASKLYDPNTDETNDSILRIAAKTKIAAEQTEESIRTLYVALTRARERLYITGTLSGDRGKAIANAELIRRSDRVSILDAGSYLSWILAALYDKTVPTTKPMPCTVDFYPHVPMPLDTAEEEQKDEEKTAPVHSLVNDECQRYVDILDAQKDYSYPLSFLNGLPTKAAASKLTPDLIDRLRHATDREDDAIDAQMELLQDVSPTFDEILLACNEVSAADIGTATHSFLQFCRFDRLAQNGVEEECAALLSDGFLTPASAEILNKNHIRKFVRSDLMQEILSAASVVREQKFYLFIPLSQLTKSAEEQERLQDHNLFVQGSIDLLLETADGDLLLYDYKTDRISDAERADEALLQRNMNAAHGNQLSYYKEAVLQMFGRKPSKTYIYSLPLGRSIEID